MGLAQVSLSEALPTVLLSRPAYLPGINLFALPLFKEKQEGSEHTQTLLTSLAPACSVPFFSQQVLGHQRREIKKGLGFLFCLYLFVFN